jgi:hypothetical protein
MSNTRKIAIAGIAVLVIALAVIALKGHHPADAPVQPVSTTGTGAPDGTADKISQADRDGFIASAIPSCQKAAAQNSNIVNAGFPPDAIEKYCRCVAEKSADVITQNELTYIADQKQLPASFETKTRAIAAGCGAENLKPAK